MKSNNPCYVKYRVQLDDYYEEILKRYGMTFFYFKIMIILIPSRDNLMMTNRCGEWITLGI